MLTVIEDETDGIDEIRYACPSCGIAHNIVEGEINVAKVCYRCNEVLPDVRKLIKKMEERVAYYNNKTKSTFRW